MKSVGRFVIDGTERAIGLSTQRMGRCQSVTNMDILRILLSILLPPVGVFLQVGFGLHFWLNILLTILGYVPGVIHAIYIILKKD
jgi:uncharacterized membrane protein YqaE (UPF0057 family)